MTDEIDDYAPALLKIKAAIKIIENAAPAKGFKTVSLAATQIKTAAMELDLWAYNEFENEEAKRKQKAA